MKYIAKETAMTIEARVTKGVRNALQRASRRFAFSSSISSGDFGSAILR